MKRLRRWCVLALLAALPAQAGIVLQQAAQPLRPDEQVAATAVITRAQALLPPAMIAGPARPVSVEWSDSLPGHVHGRALGDRILLRRALLAPAAASEPQVVDPALAALLHEVAHVHDRTPGVALSAQGRWRDLAGWLQRPWRLGRVDNAFALRTPDAYELESPAEAFAVNVEHVLLDPGYACRRPAMHAWFVQQLGVAAPADAHACPDALGFIQADDDQGGISLLALDPARVYAVDYLLAEGSSEAMTLWGHTMLRLVICAPDRPPGPACRMDLQYHRVLSFRAFVGDVQLSSWGGLAGAYPSRLFMLPLAQVIEEYTRVELRALQSIPLRLQPQEIAALLERAATTHWSYDGRYYFVTGNCAVETARLLQAASPRLEAMGINRLSPRGVLRRLRQGGVADTSVLDDNAAAIRDGYYFASAGQAQRVLFEGLRARGAIHPGVRSLEAWLDGDALQRRPWLERGDLRDSAALLVLEQAAWRRRQLEARSVLKRLLGRDDAQRNEVEALLRGSGQLLMPSYVVSSVRPDMAQRAYGLPDADELQALATALPGIAVQQRRHWSDLQDQLQAQLPESLAMQVRESRRNLELIGARMRAQAPAAR